MEEGEFIQCGGSIVEDGVCLDDGCLYDGGGVVGYFDFWEDLIVVVDWRSGCDERYILLVSGYGRKEIKFCVVVVGRKWVIVVFFYKFEMFILLF